MLVILVALLMLGLGSTVSVAKLRRAVVYWKAILVGLVCQVLLMPLLAYLLVIIFDLKTAEAVSIIVTGSVPGAFLDGRSPPC